MVGSFGSASGSTRSGFGSTLAASVAVLASLAVALGGATVRAATPVHAFDPHGFIQGLGQDTYAAFKQGIALTCDPPPIVGQPEPSCTVKIQVSLSAPSARYLGLKSTVLTSGTMTGPRAASSSFFPIVKNSHLSYGGNVYLLPFPAAVASAMKAKQVVAMALTITGTATYASTGGEQTQLIAFTGANEVRFVQGNRYGCWPLGKGPILGGDIQGGYVSYGQKCPTYPGKAG